MERNTVGEVLSVAVRRSGATEEKRADIQKKCRVFGLKLLEDKSADSAVKTLSFERRKALETEEEVKLSEKYVKNLFVSKGAVVGPVILVIFELIAFVCLFIAEIVAGDLTSFSDFLSLMKKSYMITCVWFFILLILLIIVIALNAGRIGGKAQFKKMCSILRSKGIDPEEVMNKEDDVSLKEGFADAIKEVGDEVKEKVEQVKEGVKTTKMKAKKQHKILNTILNIIWVLTGGLINAILCIVMGVLSIVTIIPLLFGVPKVWFGAIPLVFAPFGKEVRLHFGDAFIRNVIVLVFGGLETFLVNVFGGLLLCVFIITIPLGLQQMKIAKYFFAPFKAEVVSK